MKFPRKNFSGILTSRRVHKLDKSHDAPLISTHLQVAENESSEQSDMDGLPEREKIFQRNEVYNFFKSANVGSS